jgi:hypothetical protein
LTFSKSRLCFKADFFLDLNFHTDPDPEIGDVPPKRRLTFNRLHGVVSLKIVLFTTKLFFGKSYSVKYSPNREIFQINDVKFKP